MKTNGLKIGLFILALCVSMVACKDDEATATKNSFKYNDKESEIGTAFGFAFGQTDVTGVYWVDMEFFEKTFTVHYVNGYPDSISGKGDALVLAFLTNKETEIPTGEYVFKSTSSTYAAFTIDGEDATGLIVGYDAASQDDPAFVEISGGKVTVTKNADEYEFTFNLTTKINTTITGYYKGKPVFYTEKKKKSGNPQNWFPPKKQSI
jgi:hypothetical protein